MMEVLVTGMGVVSAAGVGVRASVESMHAGVRNLAMPGQFSTELSYPVFEVDVPALVPSGHGRTLALAVMAAEQALAQAGFDKDFGKGRCVGVCMGTTAACQLNDIAFYRDLVTKGETSMEPVHRFLNGDIAEQISARYGLDGPYITVVNACSSGTDAIGLGLNLIRSGMCDIVLAGGADEINHVPYCGFASLMVSSASPCAPFDASRGGLNLGEGSGVLVMESESSASKRDASPIAEVSGYSTCSDAYHLTAPAPDGRGLRAAMAWALKDAGVSPSDIAFINAHGTATKDNDKVEGSVLRDVFGESVCFLSTKGYTGHTLGAAGGVEAVFSIAALIEGRLPPSAGFKEVDSEIGISPVTQTTAINGTMAVSTSLAFGGNNSVLVLKAV